MSHFITKCKHCGTMITQCRCPSRDKPVTWVEGCRLCEGIDDPRFDTVRAALRHISRDYTPADGAIDEIQRELRDAKAENASLLEITMRSSAQTIAPMGTDHAEMERVKAERDRLRADLALACSGPALAAEFERRGIAEGQLQAENARLTKSIIVYGTEGLRLEGQLQALASAADDLVSEARSAVVVLRVDLRSDDAADLEDAIAKTDAALAKVKRP